MVAVERQNNVRMIIIHDGYVIKIICTNDSHVQERTFHLRNEKSSHKRKAEREIFGFRSWFQLSFDRALNLQKGEKGNGRDFEFGRQDL